MRDALKHHWPEYLMEAAELGVFMLVAGLLGVLMEHPTSPLRQAIPDAFHRRILTGVAMGLTGISIIYSPLGKQSGAHFNPSVTLTFVRLGKIAPWDACSYIISQFLGGIIGLMMGAALAGNRMAHPAVHYVVTQPGAHGAGIAFGAEVVISFILMSVVLKVSNTERIARYTGLFSGSLVAIFISFEAPLSGMSMNPARTLGSAVGAQFWTALWIYFIAPPVGMLLAAQLRLRLEGAAGVFCAKLHHQNDTRCIFCEYRKSREIETKKNAHRAFVRCNGSTEGDS